MIRRNLDAFVLRSEFSIIYSRSLILIRTYIDHFRIRIFFLATAFSVKKNIPGKKLSNAAALDGVMN